jgi:hypothetical protein
MKPLVWSESPSDESLRWTVENENMNSYSAYEHPPGSLRLGNLGRSDRIPAIQGSEPAASGRFATHSDPVCRQLPIDGRAGPSAVPAISIAPRPVARGRPFCSSADPFARPLLLRIFSSCLSKYGA